MGSPSRKVISGMNNLYRSTLKSWKELCMLTHWGQEKFHFTDNIFKCIFFNEIIQILLKISLKLVPKIWINNISALIQIMAWHWPGDKRLSEPVMVNLQMRICITSHQWVKQHQEVISQKVKPILSVCKFAQLRKAIIFDHICSLGKLTKMFLSFTKQVFFVGEILLYIFFYLLCQTKHIYFFFM